MHPISRHLGTFDGERCRRAGDPRQDSGSPLQDFAAACTVLAFCASFAVILLAAFLPELPR